MSQAQSVDLFYTEGASDKVYQVRLIAQAGAGDGPDAGWLVNFAYGRRGQALQTGTKTQEAVPYAKAAKIFDKLVAEKTAKGYTPDQSGAVYTSSGLAGRVSGVLPQLPTALDALGGIERKLQDPDWCMQPKMDGENRIVIVDSPESVQGINRRGLLVDIPAAWLTEFAHLGASGRTVIAGEHIGETLHAFDLLELHGKDLTHTPLRERLGLLDHLVDTGQCPASMVVLPVAYTEADRRKMLDSIRASNGEGVVFKHLHRGFAPGRSADALKFKFTDSATCMVLAHNPQRSVQVGLHDGREWRNLGNVTIPVNHDVPAVDSLVEVRYLYLYQDGCFEQPQYFGQRPDMRADDALLSQVARIKVKLGNAAQPDDEQADLESADMPAPAG